MKIQQQFNACRFFKYRRAEAGFESIIAIDLPPAAPYHFGLVGKPPGA